jgi:hypothetical protein
MTKPTILKKLFKYKFEYLNINGPVMVPSGILQIVLQGKGKYITTDMEAKRLIDDSSDLSEVFFLFVE